MPRNRTPAMEVPDTCFNLLQVVHVAVPGLSATMATRAGQLLRRIAPRLVRSVKAAKPRQTPDNQVDFDVAPRSSPGHPFIQALNVSYAPGSLSVRTTSGRTEYFATVLPLLYWYMQTYIHSSRRPRPWGGLAWLACRSTSLLHLDNALRPSLSLTVCLSLFQPGTLLDPLSKKDSVSDIIGVRSLEYVPCTVLAKNKTG